MNEEIPVMLDSTVLKQIPKLNSQLFKQLVRYANVGKFKLYLSEIVENEYLTWIGAEAQKSLDNVVKATESLNKYYDEPDIFTQAFSFNMTASIAQNHINDVLKKVINNWKEFKKKANVTVLPIKDSHGSLVMASYFSGNAPFKNIKNRSDIPDGFIYCSIVDLLEDNKKVLFVSHDKNLTNRIRSDKLICFENLSDLFSSDKYRIQEEFFHQLEESVKAKYLIKYFADDVHRKSEREIEISDIIDDFESNVVDNIIGEYVSFSTNVESLELDIENIIAISEFSYLLPFSARLSHLLSSEASSDDLSFCSEARIKTLEKSIKEDGLFEVSESSLNRVQGSLSVTFSDSNPLSWKEKKADSVFSVSAINEIVVCLEDIKLNV